MGSRNVCLMYTIDSFSLKSDYLPIHEHRLGLTWEEESLSTLHKMRVLAGMKICRNGYWVGSCHMQADIYKGVFEVLTRMSWSCPWAKPSTLWLKKQAQLCGGQWSNLGSESVIEPETMWFDLGLWQVERRPACTWKSSVSDNSVWIRNSLRLWDDNTQPPGTGWLLKTLHRYHWHNSLRLWDDTLSHLMLVDF